ncbi:MAG: sulfatase-like hydrolase/transferase [Kiritimatiellae bacterium]|nr:sulfatase-like hydrolase/transferase [Kiritimatiellia bacterium]
MAERPHILILMPDQQRGDCMGCAGHPQVKTPNMDRLAEEGTRFGEAITVCPVCMPARASFANGRYPHNHGMWNNCASRLPAEDETFFHILQRHGYLTAHIGKSHYHPHGGGLHMRDAEPYMHARGLEYVHETTGPHATVHTRSYMTDAWEEKGIWDAFKRDYGERKAAAGLLVRPSPHSVEDYQDSYVGRQAVEFVQGYADARPMCLFVGFGGPHEPWDAPGRYASMYPPGETPAAVPAAETNGSLPEFARRTRGFHPRRDLDAATIRAIRANYYGKISLIDHWFGEILRACEARGWLDDLFVVMWSDHGEMAGDHGLLHKSVFFESSVRVPLILRWPGRIPAGATSDALAEIIDVFPTILEAVGTEPGRQCVGRSLWPALREPGAPLRDCQLSEISDSGANTLITMIRTATHKYAVDQQARGFMLYDLANDPAEQRNLIGQDEALEMELRDRLLRRVLGAQAAM